MSQHDDPIEGLRDLFQSIECTAGQQARWLKRMRSQRSDRNPRTAIALANEPIPWRLIVGSGIAAAIAITVLGLGPLSPLGDEGGWSGTTANIDRVISMAEPPLQKASQSGMMWHVPATGLDLRMQVDTFKALISAPFSVGEGMAGT